MNVEEIARPKYNAYTRKGDGTACKSDDGWRRKRDREQPARSYGTFNRTKEATIGSNVRRRFIKIRIYRHRGRKGVRRADDDDELSRPRQKYEPFSLNTLPPSTDSTLSRILLHTRATRSYYMFGKFPN